MIGKVSEFLNQVKAELQKVTWPTRKDTYASTLVVIVLVLISAVYLGGIDYVLQKVMKLILS